MKQIERRVGRCPKPGCGAQAIKGSPCTDYDCPQKYVPAAEYKALLSHIDALEARVAEDAGNINLKADFIERTLNQSTPADDRVEAAERALAEAVEVIRHLDGFLANKGCSEEDPLVRGMARAFIVKRELMNKNTPAFPQGLSPEGPFGGMTLRDWFAGQALIGGGTWNTPNAHQARAERAYAVADAMIAAREAQND